MHPAIPPEPEAHGPFEAGARLPSTSWSLLSAAVGSDEAAIAARAEVAARYYRPVHAYLTAILRNPELARELTHGFFEQAILSGRLLAQADRERGPFRPYLKQALRNYVRDGWRRETRQKRHAADFPETSDPEAPWETHLADAGPEPDVAFHNAWVRALLDEAIDRVRALCSVRGQTEHFALFAGRHLATTGDIPSWRTLGAAYGLDEKTARSRTDAVGQHFRVVLRELLLRDVERAEDVDREVATLLHLL
jgi:DNA-directed RNA polymerase specialized sigma24 family protein